MKVRTLITILILTIVLIPFLSVETDEVSPPKPNHEQEPPKPTGPTEGGAISIGIDTSLLALDPLKYTIQTAPIYDMDDILYRGLLSYNDLLELSPELADSYVIEKEQNSIRLHLKKNLKFSDGTPVTLEDVRYSFEFYSHPFYNGKWKEYTLNILGSDKYRTGKAEHIEGIILEDETNSITIEYSLVDARDLQLLTAPILSKDQLMNMDFNEIKNASLKGKLLSTGPFKLESLQANQWELVKNSEYEDKVYLDKVTFTRYHDGGNFDFIIALPHYIENHKTKKLITMEGSDYVYLGMNLTKKELQDIRVRTGIANALDYNKILDKVYLGYADQPKSIIHPKSLFYQQSEIGTDVEEAKKLLKDKTLSFDLAYEDTILYQKLAEEIVSQLNSFGIQINKKPIDKKDYISELFYEGKFDLFLASWNYEYDPVFENDKWLSKNDVLNGGFNVSHVQDTTSDKKLLAAMSEMNSEERLKIYSDWQNYFMKQHYIIPIASKRNIYLVNPNLNVDIKNSLVPYKSINDWWLKQK